MANVAVFDEAIAVVTVTNSLPPSPRFQTLDGLPSDFYLRLTEAGVNERGARDTRAASLAENSAS